MSNVLKKPAGNKTDVPTAIVKTKKLIPSDLSKTVVDAYRNTLDTKPTKKQTPKNIMSGVDVTEEKIKKSVKKSPKKYLADDNAQYINTDDTANDNNKYILMPCKIPDFVNIEILKKYVKKDLDENKEYFDDLNITYRISDPKKGEWILNQSIVGGVLVGNGNTNVDITVGNNTAIDVSVLTLNHKYTNEKSIMQNFSNSNDLDTLFNTGNGEKAVEIFREKIMEKYKFKDNVKKDIYYMIFICKGKNVYMTCLKLNPVNICNMIFSGFTKSCKNISIENFIDEKFGNVKLYKSKKRLELRLHMDMIDHMYSVKLF